jgi:energy-coupling factor transport system substrate-specific component
MTKQSNKFLSIKEICIFGILGALMFVSKIVMEALPNIHLLGMLTIVYTLVFRKKALIPIYVYIFMNGLYAGFNMWWIPYLYIWTILWGITMILPHKMPKALACVVYPVICALHGLFFGALYAPVQALMFNFTFEQTLSWIAAGLTFDIIHMAGNFAVGLLIFPLSEVLKKLVKNI